MNRSRFVSRTHAITIRYPSCSVSGRQPHRSIQLHRPPQPIIIRDAFSLRGTQWRVIERPTNRHTAQTHTPQARRRASRKYFHRYPALKASLESTKPSFKACSKTFYTKREPSVVVVDIISSPIELRTPNAEGALATGPRQLQRSTKEGTARQSGSDRLLVHEVTNTCTMRS